MELGRDYFVNMVGRRTTGQPPGVAQLMRPYQVSIPELLREDPDAAVSIAWSGYAPIGLCVASSLTLERALHLLGRDAAELPKSFDASSPIALLRGVTVNAHYESRGIEIVLVRKIVEKLAVRNFRAVVARVSFPSDDALPIACAALDFKPMLELGTNEGRWLTALHLGR